MCQANKKCPQCLIAESQSKEKAGVFACQICQASFERGIKVLKL